MPSEHEYVNSLYSTPICVDVKHLQGLHPAPLQQPW
jgi:hypothetical protein